MAGKVRVYELAKELGLTNKEALSLCESLGIGVKSHSSSMEVAQADRARRKAEREGLKRDAPPPEDEVPIEGGKDTVVGKATEPGSTTLSAKTTRSTRVTAPAKTIVRDSATAPAKGKEATEPGSTAAPAKAEETTEPGSTAAPAKAEEATEPTPSSSTEDSKTTAPHTKAAPAKSKETTEPTLDSSAEDRPAAAPRIKPVPGKRSGNLQPGTTAAASEVSPGVSRAEPSTSGPEDTQEPAVRGGTLAGRPSGAKPDTGSAGGSIAGDRPDVAREPKSAVDGRGATTSKPIPPPPRPPMSTSGKPIPPPPRPPMSTSGKPIPPPPGRGNTMSFGGRGESSGPLGTIEQRSNDRTGRTPRPSRPRGAYTSTDGARRGVGERPGGIGAGSGIAPPLPRAGQRGPQRQQPKRSKRRRRNVEELEPTQLTEYKASDAPVPQGEIIVERGCTPQDLGPKLNRSAGDIIRYILFQGEMVTATQPLTDDMIELFAAELGAQVRLVDPGQEEEAALKERYIGSDIEIADSELEPRGPVVTVMGHVDHGKTLLLDRIRSSNVAAGESGGITQHIGAYQVAVNDRMITFVDTPGHEAFTAMRARGAQVTDIVVLVVAADDGVMPQTVEAIDHARSASVPIVVAVNKMDRPDADVNRTLQQLAEHGLVPEAWGGDIVVCEVSALEGTGIQNLLDHIALVADLEELESSPVGRAVAAVLEGNLDPGRGPLATIIVSRGTLKVGDAVVAGAAWGRVKALVDSNGAQVLSAGPSMPVQVLGFSRPPAAGDEMYVTKDLPSAKAMGEAVERRSRALGRIATITSIGVKLENIFEQIQRGERADLNLIVKADGQGTLQAVSDSLEKLERDEVAINFLHKGVGGITESDVQLAVASNATVIGFNVRPDRRSRELAEARGVDIRTYEIIYKLIEDIEAAVLGMLVPEIEERVTGEAEVRELFRVPRIGAIAGCYVRNGVITRGSRVRFLRDGVVIWNGTVSSLKRFKEDAREVQSGFECGVGLSDFQDLKAGDVIETYVEVTIAPQ
ncbi:MAG: translation initiation factor IF-2 [Acidimicrobiales bacterium]